MDRETGPVAAGGVLIGAGGYAGAGHFFFFVSFMATWRGTGGGYLVGAASEINAAGVMGAISTGAGGSEAWARRIKSAKNEEKFDSKPWALAISSAH